MNITRGALTTGALLLLVVVAILLLRRPADAPERVDSTESPTTESRSIESHGPPVFPAVEAHRSEPTAAHDKGVAHAIDWGLPPITGVVTDVEGLPLPDVEVIDGNPWRAGERSVFTDMDGRFALAPNGPEAHTLRFRGLDHVGRTYSGLNPGVDLEVVLADGARLKGQVVDEDGAGVEGARLWFDSPLVLTGPDGRFETVIPQPCLWVTVEANGFIPWSRRPLVADALGRPLEIGLRRGSTGAPMLVRIVDFDSGKPIEGDQIRFDPGPATPVRDHPGLWQVPTRGSGVVANDRQQVYEETVDVWVRESLKYDVYRNVQHDDGGGPIELRVPSPVSLVTRVVDANGAGLEGARLQLRLPFTGVPDFLAYLAPYNPEAFTDENGAVAIDRLFPGVTYTIAVKHPEYVGVATNVMVPLASPYEIPTIQLGAGESLRGKVVIEETGEPGRRVVVRSSCGRSTITDEEGAFHLAHVDAGSTVGAHSLGYRSKSRIVRELLGEADPMLLLGTGVSISGKAVDTVGRPLRGVAVRCWRASTRRLHQSREAQRDGLRLYDRFENTGSDGSFRIDGLDQGSYYVLAQFGRQSSERIKVVAGGPAITMVLHPPSGVYGFVRSSSSGAPVCRGVVRGPSARFHQPDLNNSEGSYFIPSNPGVPLVVNVTAPGFATKEWRFDLSDGEVRQEDLYLDAEATLEGVIRDGQHPLAGVGLLADPVSEDGRLPARAITDEHGRFRLAGMGSGQWNLGLIGRAPSQRHGGQIKKGTVEPKTVSLVVGDQRRQDLQVRFD